MYAGVPGVSPIPVSVLGDAVHQPAGARLLERLAHLPEDVDRYLSARNPGGAVLAPSRRTEART
jgi:hypothetical protein